MDIDQLRCATGPGLAARLALAAIGSTIVVCGTSAAAPARIEPDIATVLQFDQRLAATLYRLVQSNAAICPVQMPLTGMVLHVQDQYGRRYGSALADQGMFPEPLAVELVVPGSPAARAGIEAGDGLLAINGTAIGRAGKAGGRDTVLRDQIERELARLPGDSPVRLTFRRTGASLPHTVTVMPLPACRTRWEVTYDKASIGASDGDIIQISAKFVAESTDDEIAVIAAHELAHTVLGHNRKLTRDASGKASSPSLQKTRLAEDEADRFSVRLLKGAGYDPQIAVRFWQGPGKRYSGGWLRSPSHSSAKDRARMIAAQIQAEASQDAGTANAETGSIEQ